MDRSTKHLSGAGTSRMWGKIKDKFLDKTTDGTVSGQLTISKSTGTPLILKGGASVCILQMKDSSDTLLGSLKVTSSHVLRFNNGTSDFDIYHEGNANKSDVDWTCDDLTFSGKILPSSTTQEIGDQNHCVNWLYANNIVTPAGNGMRFGANNGDFKFYKERNSSWASSDLLVSIHKTGGMTIHIGGLAVANGGASVYGYNDLDSGFISFDTADSLYARKMVVEEESLSSNTYTLRTDNDPSWERISTTDNTLTLSVPSLSSANFGVVHTLAVVRGTSSGTLTITLPRSTTTPRVTVIRPADTITVQAGTYAIIKYYYARNYVPQAYTYLDFVFIEVVNGLIFSN